MEALRQILKIKGMPISVVWIPTKLILPAEIYVKQLLQLMAWLCGKNYVNHHYCIKNTCTCT